MIDSQKTPAIVFCLAVMWGQACLAGGQDNYFANPNEIVVTRDGEVVKTLPCNRVPLDGHGRWKAFHGHAYINAQVHQTSDGVLYAQVGGPYGAYYVVECTRSVMFASKDSGETWESWDVDLPHDRVIGTFAILQDDTFLAAATEPADNRVSYYVSTDRGSSWSLRSEVSADPFDYLHVDGNLLQLSDGTVVSPLHFSLAEEEGPFRLTLQCLLRSTDSGQTWRQGRPDASLWKPLIDAGLGIRSLGPEAHIPGGTFPGCYEVGIAEGAKGELLAALRYSGPQQHWHKDFKDAWRGGEPDSIGRVFRQVMFSSSPDGGVTWEAMRPFADSDGRPVIAQQETNGSLVPLSGGRLLLIHQRRFGDPYQLIGRLSEDNGQTWLPDEYHLSAGFGFPGSVVLEDDTIVTVTGKSLGGIHGAEAIIWKLP